MPLVPQPLPSPALLARLSELELALLALEETVTREISAWYAEIVTNAAHQVLCVRLEAERLRGAQTAEQPDWLLEADEEEEEAFSPPLETGASVTDGGD